MSKLRNSLCELCTALIFFCGCSNEPLQPIRSGEIWPDNNGEHINAHGGGVMYHDGTYYWFGENKCDTTSSAMVGHSDLVDDILGIKTYYEQQWLDRGLSIKYIKFLLPQEGELREPDIEIELDSYRSYNRSKRSGLQTSK